MEFDWIKQRMNIDGSFKDISSSFDCFVIYKEHVHTES